jgi:hypothetical protein
MDMNELRRRERWAELAASIAEADRPKSSLGFWLSWKHVVDDPAVAVPTPDSVPSATPTRRVPASGVGSGVARVADGHPATHRPGLGESPRAPHPLHCSEASRISAATTWHQ